MSKVQELILGLAQALHDNQISEEMCEGLYKALNGVPVNYHWEAFASMLGMEIEEAPDNF